MSKDFSDIDKNYQCILWWNSPWWSTRTSAEWDWYPGWDPSSYWWSLAEWQARSHQTLTCCPRWRWPDVRYWFWRSNGRNFMYSIQERFWRQPANIAFSLQPALIGYLMLLKIHKTYIWTGGPDWEKTQKAALTVEHRRQRGQWWVGMFPRAQWSSRGHVQLLWNQGRWQELSQNTCIKQECPVLIWGHSAEAKGNHPERCWNGSFVGLLAASGLDIPEVDLVVHSCTPMEVECLIFQEEQAELEG